MQAIVKWVLITVDVLLSVFCLCMVWNKILEFFLGYKIYWAVKYTCELLSPIAIVLVLNLFIFTIGRFCTAYVSENFF